MNFRSYLAIYALAPICFLAACSSGDHASADSHEEGGHNHEGAITLRPDQASSFGVQVETLAPGQFSEVVKVSGQVEPAADSRAVVSATRSGIFTLAHGITVGGHVGAGTSLGHISSKGIQSADPSPVANAAVESARRELQRLEPLYKDGLVSAATYNEARRAYEEAIASRGVAVAGSANVAAPAGGTISQLYVSSGQYVEAGAPIAQIARGSRLTLRADVPQRYLSSVPLFVSANFRPDCSQTVFSLSQLDGRLLSPGSVSLSGGGYIPIYFSFQSNGDITPGAFAEVYLIGAEREGVLTVPREALVEMQGNKYVYVRLHDHDDMYEKRLVFLGASDGQRVEVLSGIKEGEVVVMKGASVVRMAETSAIAPPGHSHNH